jgi:hypothetical protein
LLNCCKCLQINRTFFQAATECELPPPQLWTLDFRLWTFGCRLRSKTTLPLKWIAVRVQTGTAKWHKSVPPHLAQSQDQRKTASALEPCAQLEVQSAV